jgi:MoaA/NifB/PqqE/SkfB family radical SAM enzyme
MGAELHREPALDRDSGQRVLSIETGFSCNAYCGFCPQLNYRGVPDPDAPIDLTTEEVRARIRWGAENGYDQIGFSGGESTIRDDFVDCVEYAHSLGYRLIGITTNGLRLAYMAYAARLVRAGLTSVNISVHGHTAELHDAMLRTPGAFDLAMRALDNVQALRQVTGRRIEVMSMSLATPRVLPHFPDIVRLMGRKGVRLHMIQPFLMTKGNTHRARQYFAGYDDIARAIRAASDVAREHGGHVKLFNTPVCLMWDIEDRLERQWKPLDVFREHETGRAAYLKRDTQEGYTRIAACATCDEPCPGFRAEYAPQDDMVAELVAAMDAHVARHRDGALWVGGLELLDPAHLGEVLRAARARAGRVVLVTGAIGRTHTEQYDEALGAGVDEVCFVVHRRQAATDDRRERHAGNLRDVAAGIARLRELGVDAGSGRVSATVTEGDVVHHADMMHSIHELGVRHLRVGALRGDARAAEPWWHRGEAKAALGALADLGFTVTVLGRADPERAEGPWRIEDPEHHWLAHRRVSPEFYWIAWSVPPWARQARRDLAAPPAPR